MMSQQIAPPGRVNHWHGLTNATHVFIGQQEGGCDSDVRQRQALPHQEGPGLQGLVQNLQHTQQLRPGTLLELEDNALVDGTEQLWTSNMAALCYGAESSHV